MGDQKNLILAAALSFLVIGLWDVFVIGPQRAELQRQVELEQAQAEQAAEMGGGAGLATIEGRAPGTTLSVEEALSSGERITFDSDRVDGSIALRGGRLDNLRLKDYRVELAEESPEVTLLTPHNANDPYYALWGWSGANAGSLPGPATEWTLASGSELAVGAPVTLRYENERGLQFEQEYALDENYVFTVTQRVTNATADPIALSPYGLIARHGVPDIDGLYLLHEGAIAGFDGITKNASYNDFEDFDVDMAERARLEKFTAENNGWIGFTDKYWLTALLPQTGIPFTGAFKMAGSDIAPVFTVDARMPPMAIAPGSTQESVMRVFAGAKEAEILRGYEKELGIEGFYNAIDWGWFYFLTKPFFWLLSFFNNMVGNFGIAIIMLTCLVKLVMFPLAYKSFASMARMKTLQPQTEKIREKHKDDPQAMQKAMMEMYKKEKVNPAAGCLPMLVQIPVFFALYKVLYVTLEMRHAPFFGWIRDLSAPDPTSFLNLFGALPFDVAEGSFLKLIGIGIWPLIMGVTMWVQMQLNPPPPDPMQRRIFQWMPVMFTFMLGSFAAGLVIYWTANNILTIIQQSMIMRSQGAKIELFDNLKNMFARGKKSE